KPTNLEELLQAIRDGRYSEREMSDLPTFGGEPPADTSGVWSWDETRILTQTASGDLRIVPRPVHCECGASTGVRCAWSGPESETVQVEWMPEHLRASHRAAGNSGTWPHNGSLRLRVERSCADRMIQYDREWTHRVDAP